MKTFLLSFVLGLVPALSWAGASSIGQERLVQISTGPTGTVVGVTEEGRLQTEAFQAPGTTTTATLVGANNVPVAVDGSGRLTVTQPPPEAPPNTTAIDSTAYDPVAVTSDTFYTPTAGSTVTIQFFAYGCESSNAGSVVELWLDPNGDTVDMEIVSVGFCKGTSNFFSLNESFVGDGTGRILLRRDRLDGGAVNMFGRWEGYEQ